MSTHQVAKNVIRRIPLIKFTHGNRSATSHQQPEAPKVVQVSSSIPSQQPQSKVLSELFETNKTPLKYKRKQIQKDEIDYINRGGPF